MKEQKDIVYFIRNMIEASSKENLNNHIKNMKNDELDSFNKGTEIIDNLNELYKKGNISESVKEALFIYVFLKLKEENINNQ